MKTCLVVAISLFLVSQATAATPDYARVFAGRDGCFELYDMGTKKLVARYNPAQCGRRYSPASTFKVPLSLMAFDAGVLKNERSGFKWDGRKTARPEWNHDQTAESWMRLSVVWFSQRLTPILGMRRVRDYLAKFHYGNQDFSGGITKAWLQSSLQISPDEQLRFWDRFWREELPVSKHAFDMTKRITLIGRSRSGWTLNGKTGSAAVTDQRGRVLETQGWFVGHVGRRNRQFVFVTHYTERRPRSDRPPGWIAREATDKILKQMGIW
jgi:beta-lactamase class D/beta-lactamase class D OXA-1